MRLYEPMSGVPGLVTLIRLVLSLVVLLLPTTLMGATLPLVVKSALNRDAVIGPVLTDDRRLTETSSPPQQDRPVDLSAVHGDVRRHVLNGTALKPWPLR